MNIAQHLERAARTFPDRLAVVCAHRALTYRDHGDNEMPKNATGKILKRVLRGQALARG